MIRDKTVKELCGLQDKKKVSMMEAALRNIDTAAIEARVVSAALRHRPNDENLAAANRYNTWYNAGTTANTSTVTYTTSAASLWHG